MPQTASGSADRPGAAPARGPRDAIRHTAKRGDYRLRGLDLDAISTEGAPPQPRPRRPAARRQWRKFVIEVAVFLAIGVLITLGLRASAVEPFSVTSPSMVPNLQVGNRVLVLKRGFLPSALRAGDIIVFHRPPGATCGTGAGQERDLVKRVIATPGQKIWSERDTIYINGRVLHENGWYNPPYGHVAATPVQLTTVPPGHYFVMGDNRTDTCDSRSFGPIANSLVVGKVMATVMRNGHPYFHIF